MVSVSVKPPVSGSFLDDGFIELTNGGVVLPADIQGSPTSPPGLVLLAEACQALMDNRRVIPNLLVGDPDRVAALAGDGSFFLAIYGGRMFIDGSDLVSRADLISFTFENGDLVPRVEVVR